MEFSTICAWIAIIFSIISICLTIKVELMRHRTNKLRKKLSDEIKLNSNN